MRVVGEGYFVTARCAIQAATKKCVIFFGVNAFGVDVAGFHAFAEVRHTYVLLNFFV